MKIRCLGSRWWRVASVMALLPFMLAGAGCEGKKYAQDTPEAVLESARAMVRDGRADRLPDLLYADTRELREVWNDFGVVLRSLQQLGESVQQAYPKEIARLKDQAAEAAKRGEATSLLQQFSRQAGMAMPGRSRPQVNPDQRADQFNRLFQDLFADPFGFLDEQSSRITVRKVTDDTAAILLDGRPILGVGLTMRLDVDDKWYVVLPTNMPPLSRIMPKTPEGWQVLRDMMAMMDNLLVDLRKEVVSGRAPKLEDLAKTAGEQAALPMAMIMIAYGRIASEERRQERDAARRSAPSPQTTEPAAGGPKT